MATTWAGTADNELVSFNTLRDGILNGNLFGTAPTGSSEIMTKANVETQMNMRSTTQWNAIASNQCPTKAEIRDNSYRSLNVYRSLPSGGSTRYLVIKWVENGTTYHDISAITSTSCGVYQLILNYNQSFEIFIAAGAGTPVGTTYQFYAATSGTCGDGVTLCQIGPVNMVNNRTYYIKPSYVGGAYVAC